MSINSIKNDVLEIVNSVSYNPSLVSEIYCKLDNVNKEDFDIAIKELLDEYEIFLSKKNERILSQRQNNTYTGIINIKNGNFGFISNKFYPDFFVSSDDFNTALDKDYCLYSVMEDKKGDSGFKAKILKVIKRHNEYLVGSLYFKNGNYFLKVDDRNINKLILVKSDTIKIKVNDIVRVKIEGYTDIIKTRVVDILGHSDDIGMDISIICAKHNLDRKFSDEVINEVSSFNVDMLEEEKRRVRYDEKIFTIDSDSAKDLDDAVSIKKLQNGNYELGVYIADVSYFVREGTLVNEEALTRGTSVYLLDRVIPMLPVRLSNDLCSLNPNTDKLVIGLNMEINNYGEVIDFKVSEGIINTTKRLSYSKCNDVLENGLINYPDYDVCFNELKLMEELAIILNNKREKRGSIDFDTIEPNLVLDENGKCIDIEIKDRGISERIIEEFMIVANETIAYYINSLDLPFIYRVHDKPDNIKYNMLKNMVGKFGYSLKVSHPKELQKLLNNIDSSNAYIKNSIIRLMSKAIYSEENIGHFGLASNYYTHFTSPIRRYPDLLVHRLIRKYIFNNDTLLNDGEYEILNDSISKIAKLSSDNEKEAMMCEFDVLDMKKAEYMEKYVGNIYEAIILSVHKFGIFVGLPNTVDGLIRNDSLKDCGFVYDDNKNKYYNYSCKKELSMGMSVKVKLVNSDKRTSEIDFDLVFKKSKNGGKYGKHKGYFNK